MAFIPSCLTQHPIRQKTAVGQCEGRRVQMGMYKKCYDAVTLPGGEAKKEDRKMLKGQKSSQCFRYYFGELRLIAPPAENTFRVQWRRALVNKYEMNIMRVIVALAFPPPRRRSPFNNNNINSGTICSKELNNTIRKVHREQVAGLFTVNVSE